MAPELPPQLFGDEDVVELRSLVEIESLRSRTSWTEFAGDELAELDVLITGWGAPRIDTAALRALPRMRAIVHTGGSVRGLIGPEVWDRGIVVTSTSSVNALPVAEYTLAMILLAGKRIFEISRRYQEQRAREDVNQTVRLFGNFETVVGIVGASAIGRRVIELLRPFDFTVLVSDPTVSAQEATQLGVEVVSLDTLLRNSDVVSIHAPEMPSTLGMLGKRELELMPDGATLINTARGALIDQDALLDELTSRRLWAVLDVTVPEVPPPGHPLWSAPHVLLTPHVAGSKSRELRRLGSAALDALRSLAAGIEPSSAIDPRTAETRA